MPQSSLTSEQRSGLERWKETPQPLKQHIWRSSFWICSKASFEVKVRWRVHPLPVWFRSILTLSFPMNTSFFVNLGRIDAGSFLSKPLFSSSHCGTWLSYIKYTIILRFGVHLKGTWVNKRSQTFSGNCCMDLCHYFLRWCWALVLPVCTWLPNVPVYMQKWPCNVIKASIWQCNKVSFSVALFLGQCLLCDCFYPCIVLNVTTKGHWITSLGFFPRVYKYYTFVTFPQNVPLSLQGTAVFWYNLFKSGEGDYRTRHAACPVLVGNKWGE